MKTYYFIFLLLLSVTTVAAQRCELNDTAKRYWNCARAAEQLAQAPTDYKNAIDEYTKALECAPTCANIAYDLGLCYEQYSKADRVYWQNTISTLK